MGRVVVITGAGRGIGLAVCQLLLAQGDLVVGGDLNLDEATSTLASDIEGKKAFLSKCDVTKEESLEALFALALKSFGRVDSCIINAGLLTPIKAWLDASGDDVDLLNAVNVKGAFLTCKHAVKAMLASPHKGQGGALVFVASVASLYGQPGMGPYCASKWAVRGLSLTAAQEFAEYGIRANCVQPGATATAMFAAFPDELQTIVKGSNTLKRAADPKEVAEVMVFLAGDKSSFMNGSTVAVHAGQTPT